MVNKREEKIKKILEDEGWIVVRGGAPDFLCIKKDKGKISDVRFIEVKSEEDKLKYNQKLYRNILTKIFDAKYSIIKTSDNNSDALLCLHCGKELFYKGRGRKPKYCKPCYDEICKQIKQTWNFTHHLEKKEHPPLPDEAFKTHNRAFLEKHKIMKYIENVYYDSCPICNSKEVDYDYMHGDIICRKCGLIIGEITTFY